MQAVRLFDLFVCYVPRAAYANTRRMQIAAVDLMLTVTRVLCGPPPDLSLISCFRNYRSHIHARQVSWIYPRISVLVAFRPRAKRYKDIVQHHTFFFL